MAHQAPKTGRQRRRRAKVTLDFATGEVHDRAIDAAGNESEGARAIAQIQGTADRNAAPGLSPEELSNEDRAQLGVDTPPSQHRARMANQQSSRRWVKARKIP